jgi:deazaflavin-dependent oxidoreductase (nitroreductase family)
MWKPVVIVVSGVACAVVAVGVTFLLGMRLKSKPIVDTVRRFNRGVTNKRVLRSAGSPGAPAGLIRHVGRATGRAYDTPVGPFATDDGFVVALPYGPATDWVRNVMAAGTATLVVEGVAHQVDQPRLVPARQVAAHLPPGERRLQRIFNVEQCLALRTRGREAAPEPLAG